jgi:hypothetical protein
MVKLVVSKSDKKDKRFKAVFTYDDGKKKTRHFGLKNFKKGTYIDHKDKEIRKNYRARHEPPEKKFYNDPTRPATLSRFILWGETDSLKKNIELYKKKFNLD